MYFLNIFPLEEQYLNNAKTDELVVDPKTGHITICTDEGTEFLSNSKDMEADLNGLLSLKDRFYKEYLSISDELEDAVNKLTVCRENIKEINNTISNCQIKLININQLADSLLTTYDAQYKKYNRYLFNDMETFRRITRENSKKLIAINIILDEVKLLSQDINSIRSINNSTVSNIKKLLKL